MPISFLSDFGHQDEFVGVCHGVMVRIAPDVRIIDITHGIAPGNVRSGALALVRAVQYLPPGVVLAVVDPGVGTARRAVAVETGWGHFVGPDNGLLAPAVAMVGGAAAAVALEDARFVIPSSGATFDGRDRFSPAAAALASGQADLADLGPEVAPEGLTPLLLPLVERDGDALRAEGWWVDRYGNVETNLTPADLAALGAGPGDVLQVTVGSVAHELVWVRAYGDVDPGQGLVYVDSAGQLAVGVREGSAAEVFALGERVQLTVRRSGTAG